MSLQKIFQPKYYGFGHVAVISLAKTVIREKKKRGGVGLVPLKCRVESFIDRSEHWGSRYTHQSYCIHVRDREELHS